MQVRIYPNYFSWEFMVRYFLGLVMIAYGTIKIFGIQFRLPAEVYDYPVRALDGVTLTWLFLGHSTWFAFVLGLMEFIPAMMLLFEKTKLLGAVLLLPILVAVCFINYAYGFLPPMRALTTVLLMLNLLLLVPRFKGLMLFLNHELAKHKLGVIELLVNISLVGVVVGLIVITFGQV